MPLGYLGCYGNGWIETPALDRLAAGGVVFDQHLADCPDAVGARRAWRTGRYSSLEAESQDQRFDLVQVLREHGAVTSLICNPSCDTLANWANAWNYVRRVPTDAEGTTLECLLQAVGDALDEMSDAEKWLVWVESASLLPPWNVPEEYQEKYLHTAAAEEDEETEEPSEGTLEPLTNPQTDVLEKPEEKTFLRLQGTFAAAVSYVDAGIGILMEELTERGISEDVTVIVTSDHGQALGEHGIVGPCRPWLHEELIHVPLLIRLPGGTGAGRRIAKLTQPVDLYSTILETFGCAPPPNHGHSVLPLLHGGDDKLRTYAVSALRLGEREEWALRTPEWAFLLPIAAAPDDPPRLPQLYAKPEDRWEVNNVIQHHLETAEKLEQTLRAFVAAARQPGPLVVPALEGPSA